EAPVLIARDASGDLLRVVTTRPVVVNAGDFDLVKGIEALRQVAGLKTISTAVPVTFSLVFSEAPAR
ncbi:MAG: hypothetical protein ACK5HY_00645, partial [Parahaliea sp.]